MERNGFKIGAFFLISLFLAAVIVGADSCRRAGRGAASQQPPHPPPSKLSTCTPNTQPDGRVRLSLTEVRNEPERTSIKVVAQAVQEPADFYVPQYSMSRGRWLINEQSRAYLRDEACNEYKLKDRTPTKGKVPDSGRIQLKPGEPYELTLSFPRLLDEVKTGVLVYGDWVMPFALP
ncbi:MAG TPA: hypothetical protein VFZ34_12315 [Blastocatellia bacterium]|nr:hypothetical protein [Blastocatellia bacterium]